MKKLLTFVVALCATYCLWAETIPNDEIWYTSADGKVVTMKNSTVKGVELVSNTYNAGKGIIKFDGNVTMIPKQAFNFCDKLTSITLPDSVKSIGEYAFSNCTRLSSIKMPNTLKSIGSSAFSSCEGLTSFTFPDSVSYIEKYTFSGCNLTTIKIPSTIIGIKENAFSSCFKLTSVYILGSETGCASKAFSNCTALTFVYINSNMACEESCTLAHRFGSNVKEIVFGNDVTYIGSYACSRFSSLTKVTLPDSLIAICKCAFYDCSLSSIQIPKAVRTIGDCAFRCCPITSISIPKSVTYIGKGVFLWCSNIVSISVDTANTHYISKDNVLFNYAMDTLILYPNGHERATYTIPSSVTCISYSAFYKCPALKSITIPNTVTNITEHEFSACAIDEVFVTGFKVFENEQINSNIISAFENLPTFTKVVDGVSTSCESPTCATVVVDLTNVETSQYAKMSLNYKDIEYPLQSGVNTIFVTGLKPNATDTLVFRSQLIGSTEWRDGCAITIQTPKLELTTLQPKVPTAGEAIVCATTNIANEETKAGFEWRKYNAPTELPSSSAYAYVFNGSLQGKIKNLSNEYYKTRAFYEAVDGTRYYGEWQTFDPTESSYFDPEVHTYYLPTEPTSKKVTVRGLVTAGTDAIVEQGFEYWPTTAPSAIRRVSNDVKVVHATGQAMTATLDSLNYSTSYECRAFAKTATTTIYGEQISFVTPEDPRPIYTLTLTAGEGGIVQATPDTIYREGDQVTITATANNGFNFVQWSDMITTNPRTIIMDADITLEAIFEAAGQAIDNVNDNLNHNCNKFIRNGTLLIERNGIYYNAQGAVVE